MIDILIKRHSRRFYLDKEIEKEKEEKLLQSLLLSPTSRNLRPWEFIVVKDKSILEKLAIAKTHGSSFVKDAPMAIVVIGDPDKSDVWVEDCSIASILLELQAQTLGLGSCWVQIRNRKHSEDETASDYVKGLLNIPPHLEVESIISVGYSDEERDDHDLEDLLYDRIHSNNYGNKIYEQE